MALPTTKTPKVLVGNWAAYIAVGSFFLYLFGYLSLRFHLTSIGIGTDLMVLDERYLFAGAKFLVYFITTVPIILLILMGASPLLWLIYFLCSKLPRKVKTWCLHPTRLALTGIFLSVALIQFVMRQPFLFSNLLLKESLPEPAWLHPLLLHGLEGLWSLYFPGLVASVAMMGSFLFAVKNKPKEAGYSNILTYLLAFLVAVQCLMLPINHGILISDKLMPKVATLGGHENLPDGSEAWLIWAGEEGFTFLVVDRKRGKTQRKLITMPRQSIQKIEIIDYDPILRVLFSGKKIGTL